MLILHLQDVRRSRTRLVIHQYRRERGQWLTSTERPSSSPARARHRPGDRPARGQGRREHRDRGEDRRAEPEAAGHDLHRGQGDRGRGRQGAAGRLRHPVRGSGRRRGREDRRDVRRHRHLRQQRERDQPHRHPGDGDEALRSDAPDQHARHVLSRSCASRTSRRPRTPTSSTCRRRSTWRRAGSRRTSPTRWRSSA